MLKAISIIVMLNAFLTLVGCYHNEEVNSALTIRKSTNNNYEIEIPINHEGRGNIHQLDPSKYEFDDSDWIYSEGDSSRVNYDRIILTYERNKTEYPWRQSNIRGYIEFEMDSLKINLIVPVYKDQDTIIDDWADYEHNGTYYLKRTY